ncbi:MAG: T9SS type A sorting domain-containing protein [Bacteroidota bacterium]
MKSVYILLSLALSIQLTIAQSPKLYIQIVSHNEPTDNLDAVPGINYFKAKANALQMASIVDSKNAKWNLQTSDGFVLGALNYDTAGTSPNDIFELLSKAPYNDNIEIDPRSKNKDGRNIADQWYLLDSCGANPTFTVGGFIWAVCPPATASSIDWFRFRSPVIGNVYRNTWRCKILSGAGSLTAHCNDLNDFGIFKPLSTTDFYTHDTDPSNNLWCMGVGCAPLLDSMTDEQAIIDLIQNQVDSIHNGSWPSNKFYVTRIMTNQREYGPMFFQKIAKVIDSLNTIPSTQLQWATINETFTAFQDWQTTSGLEYSHWLCGETVSGIEEASNDFTFNYYPNPFTNTIAIEFNDHEIHPIEVIDYMGHKIYENTIQYQSTIDLTNYPKGMYILKTGNQNFKLVKN